MRAHQTGELRACLVSLAPAHLGCRKDERPITEGRRHPLSRWNSCKQRAKPDQLKGLSPDAAPARLGCRRDGRLLAGGTARGFSWRQPKRLGQLLAADEAYAAGQRAFLIWLKTRRDPPKNRGWRADVLIDTASRAEASPAGAGSDEGDSGMDKRALPATLKPEV